VRFGGRRPPLSPDPDLIRTLAQLLAETGLTEIEYADGDRRVRVAKVSGIIAAPPGPAAVPEIGATGSEAVSPVIHPDLVTAPMVGTAYLAPQPGAPAFIRLGDAVVEGQPLLIIEAMKVMNEIRSPRPGRITQILVADAQPVEYGAALMVIE
jgi:acetyl-CoA carboxylase biotin carboxyl carrier protein